MLTLLVNIIKDFIVHGLSKVYKSDLWLLHFIWNFVTQGSEITKTARFKRLNEVT